MEALGKPIAIVSAPRRLLTETVLTEPECIAVCFSFTCSPPSVQPLITIVGYVSAMVGSSISLEEPQHFSKRQLGVIYAEEPVNRHRHNAGALCECADYTHPLIR